MLDQLWEYTEYALLIFTVQKIAKKRMRNVCI